MKVFNRIEEYKSVLNPTGDNLVYLDENGVYHEVLAVNPCENPYQARLELEYGYILVRRSSIALIHNPRKSQTRILATTMKGA